METAGGAGGAGKRSSVPRTGVRTGFACSYLPYLPTRPTSFFSVPREGAGGFRLEVEIRLLADVDPDAQDGAARERPGRFVVLADVVAAVAPDAQAVAGQRELADLGPHRTLRDDLVIHVQLRRAGGFLVLAGAFADELD